MKIFTLLFFLFSTIATAQEAVEISGKISSNSGAVAFANISVIGQSQGTSADREGNFSIKTSAETSLKIQAIGYKTKVIKITPEIFQNRQLIIQLEEDQLGLDQVVISATRNRVNLKEAPVVVNVLSPKLFNATQSISVAEGRNKLPKLWFHASAIKWARRQLHTGFDK